MINRQELEGQWKQVKGRVQEKWGDLTDDELQHARGSAEQLVGVIEERTGESRRVIEDFLEECIEGGSTAVAQMTETAREYADRAGTAARDQYGHAVDSVQAGIGQAQYAVRNRPMESVAVAFGAGIITGVVLGLSLRSR